jgi:alpha-mannosidase
MGGWSDGPPGTLSTVQAGIELSRPGILVTGFGKNPDGQGLVLRLWELAGKAGPCQVRLPAGLNADRVQPVNLRGEPEGQPVTVLDGAFTVNIQAFAPVSVQIVSR